MTVAAAQPKAGSGFHVDADDGALTLTSIDTVLLGFAASRPVSMVQLKPPPIPGTERFAAIFSSLAQLNRQDWHGRTIPQVLIDAAKTQLGDALGGTNAPDVDLNGGWLRPWVSRMMHHAVGLETPWTPQLYNAAYGVVRFLDGKHKTDEAMALDMRRTSAFLEASMAAIALVERDLFLARFAQFATGHETPANLVASAIFHGGLGSGAPIGAVLAEALRIAPPIRRLRRVSAIGFHLGGINVAAGTPLILDLGLAGRDPRHFTEPDRFLPNRPGPRHTNLFLGNPSAGCPGRQIGLLIAGQLYGVLSRLAPEGLSITETHWIDTGDIRAIDTLMVQLRHNVVPSG